MENKQLNDDKQDGVKNNLLKRTKPRNSTELIRLGKVDLTMYKIILNDGTNVIVIMFK
jgi:hypothetical protein